MICQACAAVWRGSNPIVINTNSINAWIVNYAIKSSMVPIKMEGLWPCVFNWKTSNKSMYTYIAFIFPGMLLKCYILLSKPACRAVFKMAFVLYSALRILTTFLTYIFSFSILFLHPCSSVIKKAPWRNVNNTCIVSLWTIGGGGIPVLLCIPRSWW